MPGRRPRRRSAPSPASATGTGRWPARAPCAQCSMGPMRILDQQIMNRVFAVTDELPLDREALQVELVLEGAGKVERTPAAKVVITLPHTHDLQPSLPPLPTQ